MGAFTGKTVLILGGSRGIGAAIIPSKVLPRSCAATPRKR